ncbi:hypothetical protein [Deferrisoma palaeochoriense]
MDDRHLELLYELHRDGLSRNRFFERFRDPALHRAWRMYRTLRSLRAEAGRPGTRVTFRPRNGGERVAVVERPGFRYRRLVVLPPWAARFWDELWGPPIEAGRADLPPPR